MSLVKDPDKFLEKVRYLYDHPDETSRDEIELKDETVLDRYSSPVRGKQGAALRADLGLPRYYSAEAKRGCATLREGSGRSRQPRQERVSGKHEPRDPYAFERRDRHDRLALDSRPNAEQREYLETIKSRRIRCSRSSTTSSTSPRSKLERWRWRRSTSISARLLRRCAETVRAACKRKRPGASLRHRSRRAGNASWRFRHGSARSSSTW